MIYLSILAIMIGIAIGMPIAFVFLGVTAGLVFWTGTEPSFLLPYAVTRVNNPVLLAFPMFILAGFLMSRGRLGYHLVTFVDIFVGNIRGGVGAVLVVTCGLFGAITGSVAATASTIGTVMFPKLEEAGYPKGYSAALVANSSILGMLIPPSGLMIVYGWIAGQSIVAVFAAILVPGLILMTLLVGANFAISRRFLTAGKAGSLLQSHVTVSRRRKTLNAMPALAMPIIILGGIYAGLLTPTEAAALSAFYAIPVGLWIYRGLTFKDIVSCLVDSAVMAGVIIVMLMSALMLSRIYIMEGVPQQVLGLLLSVSDKPWTIILLVNIFLIIVGMVMDDLSGILLATPLLLPIMQPLGIDPVQFAAVLAVNLGMGLVTPPTAPLLFVAGHLTGAKMAEMMNPTLLFILFAWLPTLLLTTFMPQVALWLPYTVFGLN